MAGLLDAWAGDDTTKDEYGMTQADRRQPLWSGLINAGLLAIAGGQRMLPEQRAQYIAQAGGALAGIPDAMTKLRSDAAQNMLRQQQIASGKTKLEAQKRFQAYANSPELQTAMEKMDPATKFALKAAIDAGDVDAFQRIMTGQDTAANRAAQLEIAREKLDLAKEKAEQSKNAIYKGTGIEAQHMNNLAQADPSSQEYLLAYRYFSKPRKAPDGSEIPAMDLTGYPEPTFVRSGKPAEPKPGEPQTPDQIGDGLQPGENKTLDNGLVVSKDYTGAVRVEMPDGTQTVKRPNQPKQIVAPAKLNPHDQSKLTEMKTTQTQVAIAADDFLKEWRAMSPGDRVKALAGVPTKATAAWTNLAMLVKGAAVYNLGVITGPDLKLLQGAVADPSSFKSLATSADDVEAQIGKILRIMDAGVRTHENNLLHPPKAGQPAGQKKEPVYKKGADGVWRLEE
jgi:hypothetical protein